MTYLKGKNNKLVIFDVAKNPVVSHPISPNTRLITNQPLAKSARILASIKMLQKPRNQYSPYSRVKL